MPSPVIIIPGIGNSGPLHWQTLWEQSNPEFVRLQPRDWDEPICEEWSETLETAAKNTGPDVVLVAHSLACLVVAHWASGPHSPIKAALLVAVPDPAGPYFPKEALGFSNTPTGPLNFRSTVVVSEDDAYTSPERARGLARSWGSKLVDVGKCGHINAGSNLGAWPQGFELLNELRA